MSCVWRVVAIVFAALPLTVNVAEAGPVAASSDGVEPAIVGNPDGRLSQMRPQSVSDWLAVPWLPAAAVAVATAAGDDGVGDADEPADEHAASAIAATTDRPMTR